jgi:geranylgeranyl diphosphate synthase type I
MKETLVAQKTYGALAEPRIEIERVLREKADAVTEIMLEMVSALNPIEFREAAEHLIVAGGKRARPVIALLACEAVGGEVKFALPCAVSVELVHTASLVHDDIIDSNVRRRGVDSVHVRWGVPTAVLTGDMLLSLATSALLNLGKRAIVALPTEDYAAIGVSRANAEDAITILDIFTKTYITLCQGKEMDTLFKKKANITEAEVLELMHKKTAVLYELAAVGGALAGNASPEELDALRRYGVATGMGFQIKDNILGLLADETEFGKHVGADIREGKKTIMIAYGLKNVDHGEKRILLEAMGNKEADLLQIEKAVEVLQKSGSVEYARGQARAFGVEAKRLLQILKPSEAREHLAAIADYLMEERYW